VVVPVALVGCVPVPVVNIVGVVVVRHGHVTALRPMLMRVTLMRHVPALCAFVGMVAVGPVKVPVVNVIGVTVVRKRDVTTAFTVGMLVAGMSSVLSRVGHRRSPSCRRAELLPYKDISI
jgi:hypothetical protein